MRINAPLSFGSGFAGGALSNPVGAYQGAYMDYLKGTSQQYNNVLSGYQQTMDDQRRRQKNVAAGYANAIGQTQAGQAQVAQGYDDLRRNVASGYRNLSDSVLGRIEGTNEANLQSIADQYGQSSARAGQQMVNRGLGNTTIQQSVQRGLDLDNAKAVTDSQNRFAQLQAGYAANIGQAGLAARAGIGQAGLGYRGQAVRDLAAQNQAALNYRGGAIQDSTDLANRQLNWMNSVNITPPNAKDYAALAGQMGAVQQGAPRFNPGQGAAGPMGQWGPNGGGGGGVRRPGNNNINPNDWNRLTGANLVGDPSFDPLMANLDPEPSGLPFRNQNLGNIGLDGAASAMPPQPSGMNPYTMAPNPYMPGGTGYGGYGGYSAENPYTMAPNPYMPGGTGYGGYGQ